MAALNAQKKEIVDGFDRQGENLSQQLLEAMQNGDLL
jgi:hypothetical protein